MTKYYRVHNQQEWDWLKNKLEIKDDLQVSIFPVTILYGDIFCGIYKYHDDPEPLIEVSQMMEDEKMEDYVTIQGEDLKNIEMFRGDESKGNLRELWDVNKVNIPKSLLYPKVCMSVAEKKEFDGIREEETLYNALDVIEHYPHLYKRIYGHTSASISEFELEFARAWADESLIEVLPEDKYWVKCYPTDNCYFYKYEGKILAGVPRVHFERFQFTTDEIVKYHLDGTENIFEKVEVSE